MRVFVFLVFGLACVSIGWWRYELLTRPLESDELYSYVDKKIEVKGIIISEPSESIFAQKLHVHATTAEGKFSDDILLVSAPLSPKFHYGDELVINGTLRLPEDFTGSSGQTFAYIKYLQKSGIRFELKASSVSKKNPHPVVRVATDKGNPIISVLLKMKLAIVEHVRRVLPMPEAGLFEGLVLGEDTLPEKNQDDFRHAGIIHIVVLSGYNMTLVAEAISAVLIFLPLYIRLGSGAVGVILFALMAGPSATVVRATLMVLIAMLAKATGRLYDVKRALWVSAVLMIVQNPLILLYDPSFQLSFLATFGLIYFSPLCAWFYSLGILSHWPNWALKEIVVSSSATQIVVLPFLIHMTGYLSVISLVSNCAVLPFIPFAMSIGSIAAGLSFISLKLAYIPVYIVYMILSYIVIAARFFANAPYALVAIPASWKLTGGIYVLYLSIWMLYRAWQSERTKLLLRHIKSRVSMVSTR